PVDRPRSPRPSHRGARIDFTVDPALHARMADLAGRRRATVFMVAHAALAVLLGRIGDNHDVVVGTPSAGRDGARLDRAVGMFVNMLALRTRIGAEDTGTAALEASREAALHAFTHSGVPFDAVVGALDLTRSAAHHPVFQVGFSYQNLGAMSLELPGLEATVIDDSGDVAEFDLHLTLAEDLDGSGSGGLTGQLVYATELFDEATAREFVERYLRILTGMLDDPDLPVGDLALLAADEPGSREDAAVTSSDVPARGLADGFWAQARRTPDADAVVVGDRALSYARFGELVASLAADLLDHGVGADDRVAVTAPRGLEQLVAMYAVATAGAAYVPVDPDVVDRAQLILSAADPLLVVGAGPAPRGVVGERAYLDVTGRLSRREAVTHRIRPVPPAAAAYVLFTSGSSGVPKGVSVPHAAVGTQLKWMQQRYPLGSGDTVLVRTAAGFDLSVWEYWWALQAGARIVVAEPGSERDGIALRRQLDRHAVTVLPTVPSSLSMLLDAGELPSSVHTILCIGEELTPELVGRLRATGCRAQVHNLYGPTECAVSATGHRLPDDGGSPARIPIGAAQPAVSVRVLDRRLHPVPVGVVGELYLGGPQVARGYHGDPARTAAAFVADPIGGGRMYRTGDLVRYLRTGELEFVGRADFQLQIHGFRVEPGEVEAALRRCADVDDAVVVADAGGERLLAFVTGAVDADAVTRELVDRLPGYLRPEVFVLETLPYNSNGKVDRARLPRPERARRRHLPPVTETECAVAETIAEVTGVSQVGMADGFFALGGNSLSATRVAALLSDRLGRPVPVRLVFDAVDVADIAARIDRGDLDGPVAPPLVRDDRPGPVPLAPAQRRIWEAVRSGQGADWNVPIALRFTGEVSVPTIAAALLDVLAVHEGLRTRYRAGDSGPHAEALPMARAEALVREGLVPEPTRPELVSERVAQAAWEPLRLADAPLRVRLFTVGDDAAVLLLVLHHLNVDGHSAAVLGRDVLTAFTLRTVGQIPTLPAPTVRY
ncbi:non-ribosomal peptide synthetase, partial [Gordonia sp. (in: high G+C Gram-positive bacteria)]|uniref:non-ribosomal peptide synthetase n=1 Tax=Gordonia sp. (in: high G+C Gram-positive bacteria) TaxID=84139 RepID=UPI003C722CD1